MSKKKKRRHRLGGPGSQNVALGQSELIVRTLAQEPRVRLRLNAAGVEKMSNVLLRFAEPILDRFAPLDEKKAALLFSELTTNSARHRADFEMLIQRKTELYPRNRRLFMDLEVAEGAGGLHVNVVSTDLDRMG